MKTLAWYLSVAVLAYGLVAIAANVPSQYSSADFVRRAWHGTFVLDNTLYIDGGEMSIRPITNTTIGAVSNYTLAIDLSSSFSTLASDYQITVQALSKGDCPNFNRIKFWIDYANLAVYAYGGEYSYLNPWIGGQTVPAESFWAFTPNVSGGGWNNIDQSYSAVWNTLTRPAGGGTSYGSIGGFNLGGYSDSRTSQKTNIGGYRPEAGLQFYNFTDQSWTNSSILDFSPDGVSWWGGAQYVPTWGPAGLLIALGGFTSPETADLAGETALLMNNVSVFDPAGQKWYHQPAFGNFPDPRYDFCIVGAGSAKNETYEIFIHSGFLATAGTGLESDEVYVLSLPAFQWFKANYTPSDPRIYLSCTVAGPQNRQMLSIGGLNSSTSSWNESDPFTEGIKVFDMTALAWTDYFDASAEAYVAADVIQEYYNKNSHYPAQWADQALKALFVPSRTSTNSTNSTATPTHTSTPASTPTPTPSSNHTGAITGGVVGGVAFLVILALLVWYMRHRKIKKDAATQARAEEQRKARPATFEKPELPSAPPKHGGPGAEMPAAGAQPFPGRLQDGSRHELPVGTESVDGQGEGGRVRVHEMNA